MYKETGKWKAWLVYRKQKQSIQTGSEEAETLDLLKTLNQL